ncbi:methyltransferase domain-containing protein [Sphingomonas sp. BK235]|uniref:methyltransferase domain-containing protein n=1 Tax=Sphingomonas sp. BK235 TaxID=2512131 RepID=UPI001047EDC7|nr:methyltransferase domain-containing protein [Sphingomonas sp. BK235]TCP29379.1 methyltransferase family protein [Sphingomonas sp. BK235]
MSAAALISSRDHSPIACRLCDNPAHHRFTLDLIRRHRVHYYECAHCGSLQTEAPYWLDEAYANSNLARLDTGAAQRNLSNLGALLAWIKLARIQTVIDVGGGDGLLCRLLRDYGVDARLKDRYAANTYAQGFEQDPEIAPILLTAFEVLEHYACPKQDLSALFDNRPDSVVVTTSLYEGQDSDWWYLTPDSGQHVFFYTQRAMHLIAERYGYEVAFIGHYTLFNRSGRITAARLALARAAMGSIGSRLLRSAAMLLPARGALSDFNRFYGADRLH